VPYKGTVQYAKQHLRSHIANIAKSYILNNWRLINDWSDLEVVVTHGPTGYKQYYYSYKDKVKKRAGKAGSLFYAYEKERKRNQNPVVSIDEVVLDPTDGDFSITINGKEYWWIDDDAVIIIADFIEKQLKEENSENN
jgi:hypothetical protein